LGAGIALIVLGGAFLLAGIIRLGPNLTPLPYPKDRATLVETGAYRWARHPMYGGGILVAFGWALVVRGGLTLGYAIVLLIFADIKSRREERWLRERFAGYAAYARRVKKLVPFVY
jgi:protein-S-isoprenylcysteine O-methyltransferase Ste14